MTNTQAVFIGACLITAVGVFSFTFAAVADVPTWDTDAGKSAGLIAVFVGAVLGIPCER
jgi:hypothetical protein